MKLKRLQRKVALDMISMGAFFAVLTAVYMFVMSQESSLESEYKNKKSSIASLNQNVTKIEDDVRKASNSSSLYLKLQNPNYSNEALSRDKAKDVLNGLQKKYELTGLKIKIKPAEIMKSPDFSKPTVSLVYSQVDLEFGAFSDESILQFVDSLRQNMPGIIHFNSIGIQRKGIINEATLAQVRSGMTPELAAAKVSFYWLGFKPVEAQEQQKEQKL